KCVPQWTWSCSSRIARSSITLATPITQHPFDSWFGMTPGAKAPNQHFRLRDDPQILSQQGRDDPAQSAQEDRGCSKRSLSQIVALSRAAFNVLCVACALVRWLFI